MRLLHTSTFKLSEFYGDDTPKYAILSHTWGKAEVSLHDLQKEASELDGLEGYIKIKACCALAAREGHQHVWIDTCCIDKTSSAELSEAINSMYRWYQTSQVCYAYLADFCIGDRDLQNPSVEKEFRESRWFTRGWTLQELLAPKFVVFFDREWHYFGSKPGLRAQISLITGIQQNHIFNINGASAAQKISWASGRKTTRVEDAAYSLMGIFDVNMPLLYGEGNKAFMRLQHEIAKMSDDETIFAWTDGDLSESGIFAQSSKAFAESGNIVQIINRHELYVRRTPYAVTNRGLGIEIFAGKNNATPFISDGGVSFVPLNCIRQRDSGTASVQQLVAIELECVSGDNFVRSSPGHLISPSWHIDVGCARMVYVRPLYTFCNPHEQQSSFFINVSSLSRRGLSILETYGCQPEQHLWDGPQDERCWRITIEGRHHLVALLMQSSLNNLLPLFAVILRATKNNKPSIDLIVLPTDHSFQRIMDEYRCSQCHIYHPTSGEITKVSTKLREISLALEWRKGKGKWQQFVEIITWK